MSDLADTSALGGLRVSRPGINLVEVIEYELVSLAVAMGAEAAFAAQFRHHFGVSLPQPNQSVSIEQGHIMWIEPSKYLILVKRRDVNLDRHIAGVFGDTAYAVLLSDGWANFTLSGLRTSEALERFIPLDLRTRDADFAARTSAHHISVIVMAQVAGYTLLTPRSSALSFVEGLKQVMDNLTAKAIL